MGRPSKLSESQRLEIERRLTAGEKPADLAREFKVSPATMCRVFAKPVSEIKAVAQQLVSAEVALRALPVSQQLSALSLAEELRTISTHLAGAARFGAATAHRLAGIANANVAKVDDATPLDEVSMESLKGVAVLTRMANDSATIGLNLLNANKDAVKRSDAPPVPDGLGHFYGGEA